MNKPPPFPPDRPTAEAARAVELKDIERLALHQHMTLDGEYGCPGVTCPGVQRLVAFGVRCIELTRGGSEQSRADLKDVVSAGSPSDLSSVIDLESETLIASLEMEIATLRSTHATLQRALRNFGRHRLTCPAACRITLTEADRQAGWTVEERPCNCGFDAALNGAPGTE